MTWKERRVAEMADLVNGFPFESSSFRSDEGMPLVRVRDILSEPFETFVPPETVPVSAVIRNGDVVIGMDGDFNVVHWARGAAALNQRLCLLRENGSSDMRFLAYALPTHLRVINDLTYATTVKHLSSGQVRAIRLQAPVKDEQKVIADYLDRETARIDALIGEQQRLIEMLRERRRALVRNALTRDGRGWSVDKLGRRAQIGNGSTPRRDNQSYWSEEGFPWLNSAVVNLESVESSDQFVTDVALAECHLPVVEPGSVLVGLTGQGKTRAMATLLATAATVNQHLAYVTPENDFWDSRFLLWTIRAAYDDLRAVSDENGSTKGGLTCGDLKSFRVSHPELDEQRRIAAYLDDETKKLDRLVVEAERFIELSRERRAALITAVVTGQIDVREVA